MHSTCSNAIIILRSGFPNDLTEYLPPLCDLLAEIESATWLISALGFQNRPNRRLAEANTPVVGGTV